jgi:hypothetical protein
MFFPFATAAAVVISVQGKHMGRFVADCMSFLFHALHTYTFAGRFWSQAIRHGRPACNDD